MTAMTAFACYLSRTDFKNFYTRRYIENAVIAVMLSQLILIKLINHLIKNANVWHLKIFVIGSFCSCGVLPSAPGAPRSRTRTVSNFRKFMGIELVELAWAGN